MVDKKYIKLIHRSLSGELSREGHMDLQNWLDQSPENRRVFEELEKTWKLSQEFSSLYQPDVDHGLELLKKRIRADKAGHTPAPRRNVRSMPVPFAVAAAILLLIAAFAVWNFWLKPAELMIVSTREGERKAIVLDDGSSVILNENSRLRFPEFFRGTREVELSGEGYFEIKRDEKHHFVVKTPKTITEVLGTRFNLRAYENEAYTEVEVLEGLVRLEPVEGEQPLQLEKGARGTYQHETASLLEDHPKALNATYWKDRQFRFRGHELSEAIEEINSRLDIHVAIGNPELQTCLLTQKIALTHPDTLISIIAEHYGAKMIKKENKDYLIEGGQCPSSN